MIHIFSYHDHYYIYDVGSGSLHECDEKTARVLEGDKTDVSDEELKAILEDAEALKEQGLLYKEEVKAYPMKSHEVKALCLHVSHDCNLRCKYCFADEGAYHSKREVMSRETAFAAIDFLLRESGQRKVLEVDFFGGEPLMNLGVVKDTVYYAKEQAAKLGKRFLFTTTTRKTVNGKGSFDLVIEKIKKFVRSRGDKHYYVRGTFTAKNLDFAKDVLFLADQGFDSISMEPVVTDIPELQIKEEHLPRIEKEYENLCEAYLEREEKGEGFNFFHFNIDLEGGPCLSKRVSACGAGNEYFSVVPNGDIYPCHQFAGDNKWKMGNVFEGKLNDNIRSKFAESCLFTRKKCENCFAKFICSGGCSANNYHYNGDIEEPYAMTCAMMKKRIECAMHILAARKCREK